MKTAKAIVVFILCVAAVSVSLVQSSQGIKANSQGLRAPATAKWTIMVYLDADNSLDSYASYSLGMMEQVGSTDNVEIVALWDGLYTPAYMYKVVSGGLELVDFGLNGQEINMGDPLTLETFVDFSVSNYQAEHYILVLWDHGSDVYGICWDEHPVDHLALDEVASALSGHHIDVLSTDACLMSMVEVAYEFNQCSVDSDYLVGSENYVPVAGYPYDTILSDLNQNPAMSELEVVQTITSRFAEFYEPRPHFNGGVMATLSAIDLSEVDEVTSSLATFTATLMEDMEGNHRLIDRARSEGTLPWSEYGWERYVDLQSFVEYIVLETADPDVRLAGSALLATFDEAVAALGNSEPMEEASAHGMGIWFPASHHSAYGLSTYESTRFASAGWLDFLYAYWNDSHS